ncbi:hypothetical protein OJF2_52460 [Aquisphaera giovannonii]|uniref:Uncharacterized protein n=1 Tax=Aquisphaera giovannonii TaxID=406548 RepID=A0A5B9W9B5_9BACT|nr:hypothetical protein OJF2_52460 [Aquisphaera giovannonii]
MPGGRPACVAILPALSSRAGFDPPRRRFAIALDGDDRLSLAPAKKAESRDASNRHRNLKPHHVNNL